MGYKSPYIGHPLQKFKNKDVHDIITTNCFHTVLKRGHRSSKAVVVFDGKF